MATFAYLTNLKAKRQEEQNKYRVLKASGFAKVRTKPLRRSHAGCFWAASHPCVPTGWLVIQLCAMAGLFWHTVSFDTSLQQCSLQFGIKTACSKVIHEIQKCKVPFWKDASQTCYITDQGWCCISPEVSEGQREGNLFFRVLGHVSQDVALAWPMSFFLDSSSNSKNMLLHKDSHSRPAVFQHFLEFCYMQSLTNWIPNWRSEDGEEDYVQKPRFRHHPVRKIKGCHNSGWATILVYAETFNLPLGCCRLQSEQVFGCGLSWVTHPNHASDHASGAAQIHIFFVQIMCMYGVHTLAILQWSTKVSKTWQKQSKAHVQHIFGQPTVVHTIRSPPMQGSLYFLETTLTIVSFTGHPLVKSCNRPVLVCLGCQVPTVHH